ncbi:hypothetical protein ACF0H5_020422 [Mactra antiquata]
MEKFLLASRKTAKYLCKLVDDDGVLKHDDINMDLCSQYKLTTLLLISGYTKQANKLLDRIKKDFMQPNGDFLSYPEKKDGEQKSSSFPMTHFWSYMNAWIAMAAHRLGRFDISYPAFEYCKTYFNPNVNMVCVTEPYNDSNTELTMDCLSTSHFGLLCLYMGDLEKAKLCGEGMITFIAEQPDIDNILYLRKSVSTGKIITVPPENMEPFFMVKKDSPKQLYFFIGYVGIFMAKLFQATDDQRYFQCAKSMIDFALTCHESICMFSFSHKVGYAAALVAKETKEAKYRRLAIGLGEYLISIQTEEGLFCKEMDIMDRFDQSAEIAIWLREMNSVLSQVIT